MTRSLTQAIRDAGSAVELLRNSQAAPQLVPVVPAEYTNWIAEQLALRDSCSLYDQSHHMVTVTMEGPDLIPFLAHIGVNNFDTFAPDSAKQFVACAPDGNLIGQGILFYMSENRVLLVGPHPIMDWVEYNHAVTPNHIKFTREGTSLTRQGSPSFFRYQLQGPTALDIMRDLLGDEPPALKFFHMGHVTIAGRDVTLLRHGMSGLPGFEMFGEWADQPVVLDAVMAAGQKHGLSRAGADTYFSGSGSGYFPAVVPAIYTAPELADYRDWLTDRSWEATAPLGGSFSPKNIEDYYLTPFAVGYRRIISMNHDFIGRDSIQRMIDSGEADHKKKVSLIWNSDDVVDVYRSFFRDELPAKFISMPNGKYSTIQFDAVLSNGQTVGISGWVSASAEDRAVVSTAIVDADVAEGAEVTIRWGEEPNSKKILVEPHKQVEVRATVAPSPLGEYARKTYRRD
ncbi:MAG: aminomethyl transferase family protein [Terrimesophilobacter sp.]